jgi:hypothetical protein
MKPTPGGSGRSSDSNAPPGTSPPRRGTKLRLVSSRRCRRSCLKLLGLIWKMAWSFVYTMEQDEMPGPLFCGRVQKRPFSGNTWALGADPATATSCDLQPPPTETGPAASRNADERHCECGLAQWRNAGLCAVFRPEQEDGLDRLRTMFRDSSLLAPIHLIDLTRADREIYEMYGSQVRSTAPA